MPKSNDRESNTATPYSVQIETREIFRNVAIELRGRPRRALSKLRGKLHHIPTGDMKAVREFERTFNTIIGLAEMREDDLWEIEQREKDMADS